MTAAVGLRLVDRVDRRTAALRKHEVHAGRAPLLVIAAVFFSVGWLAGKVFTAMAKLCYGLKVAAIWTAAAIAEGWRAARPRAARAG